MASAEPKAETKSRSTAPKNGLCCQPLLVEAGFGGSLLEAVHSGTHPPLLKQPLHSDAGSQTLIGTQRCTAATPCQEVRTPWRCTSCL